eukprot:scaffold60462_cov78-Phaeocystis_antarctica.AAC.1
MGEGRPITSQRTCMLPGRVVDAYLPHRPRGTGGGCSEGANMWGDIWRNVVGVPAWQLASFLNSLSGGA